MSTSGKGGDTLKKTVTVITDDPSHNKIPLTIKGQVIEIYALSARSVKLKGVVGEPLQGVIRLVPNQAYAFKILEITAKRGEKIRFHFSDIKEGSAPGYEITVENTATEPGVYFDTLYLKTDSEKKPEIEISVVGSIHEKTEPSTDKQEG